MVKVIEKNGLLALFLMLVFLYVFVFYTRMHPLYMFDIDDWYHVYMTRPIYPIWNGFNPSKVLPEILMPLVFEIAMSVIYPFCFDITLSMCIATSAVLALLFTTYIYCFYNLLRIKIGLSQNESIVVSLLFFLFHFLIYRANNIFPNKYAFYSYDVACYYHYIIPSVINASLVMYFIANNTFSTKGIGHIKAGILALIVYLAIFSNLYSNIILVAYVFLDFLSQMKKNIKNSVNLRKPFYCIHIIILSTWIIALIFEANGGRSKIVGDTDMWYAIENAFLTLFHFLVHGMNKFFLLIVGVCVVYALLQVKRYPLMLIASFGSIFIVLLYYVLLSSKVNPLYVERTDAIFGFSFYIILFVTLSISLLVRHHPMSMIFMPFLACAIIFQTNIKNRTFLGIEYESPEKIRYLNNKYINEIINASKSHQESLQIVVPFYQGTDNWPLGLTTFDRMRANLQKHGLIEDSDKMEIEVVVER